PTSSGEFHNKWKEKMYSVMRNSDSSRPRLLSTRRWVFSSRLSPTTAFVGPYTTDCAHSAEYMPSRPTLIWMSSPHRPRGRIGALKPPSGPGKCEMQLRGFPRSIEKSSKIIIFATELLRRLRIDPAFRSHGYAGCTRRALKCSNRCLAEVKELHCGRRRRLRP